MNKHWQQFLPMIERSDLFGTGIFKDMATRSANIGEVYKFLGEQVAKHTTGYWLDRFSKTDLRRLQRYFVNLYQHQFDLLQALGQIKPLLPNLELFVLSEGFYDDRFGIVIEERPTEDFIL